ncbi:Golgi-associated RAB2 interactor protein 5B [Petaurus breviceps papuanus]|uniref:Golgi-associated RAB2 interactor protein 5B n=1 Tax=Petaurus breviceps papuanus TaxID=3040969 RepID=UPI0036DE7411
MMSPVSSPAILHKRLFLNDVERSFQPWVPLLGHLQRTMMEGNYLPLGPLLPMFESDFLQVTNRGEAIFLHNKENPVTMGVASSIPGLLLPDLILLARPVGNKRQKELELTRLLPTHLARLFVHNVASWRLKLRLASGCSFYLQLDADQREGCLLFNRWRYLVYLLQGPVPAWAPQAYKAQHPSLLSSASKLKTQKMSRAGSTTLKAKEMMSTTVSDSLPFMSQLEPPDWTGEEKKPGHRHPKMGIPGTQAEEEGQSTVNIWTLFSIISSTLNLPKASKASSPMSSTSGSSRWEPCRTACQTSSSWMGSRRPSKKIFHSSDSSSTYLYSGSQSQTGFSMTWENVHPHRRAWLKSPSVLSNALAWATSLSHSWAQPQPQTQDLQHEAPPKTNLSVKLLKKTFSKLSLGTEKAAESPHVQFSQQEEKKSHPKSTPYLKEPYEATKMSHPSTKASLYPPLEDSPDHFIKAPEPSSSPKIPQPSPSPKAPQPSPSPKTPEPSPFLKVPEPSPSPKVPQPSPSPKPPEPSGSTKATPKQSTKASSKQSKKSAFHLSTKASSKQSKKSAFHPFTKVSPDHFTKDSKAHPVKASSGQAIKASDKSSSDQALASTAVSLALHTPDSTNYSKEASSYPSTKTLSDQSKKTSKAPSNKASPRAVS